MKVVNSNSIEPLAVESASFNGPVTRQNFFPGESKNFVMAIMNFSKGVHNKFHTHTCDQILIVTAGVGLVVTKQEQVKVSEGDVILIPANEVHWHGAGEDSEFSHITITDVSDKIQFYE